MAERNEKKKMVQNLKWATAHLSRRLGARHSDTARRRGARHAGTAQTAWARGREVRGPGARRRERAGAGCWGAGGAGRAGARGARGRRTLGRGAAAARRACGARKQQTACHGPTRSRSGTARAAVSYIH